MTSSDKKNMTSSEKKLTVSGEHFFTLQRYSRWFGHVTNMMERKRRRYACEKTICLFLEAKRDRVPKIRNHLGYDITHFKPHAAEDARPPSKHILNQLCWYQDRCMSDDVTGLDCL